MRLRRNKSFLLGVILILMALFAMTPPAMAGEGGLGGLLELDEALEGVPDNWYKHIQTNCDYKRLAIGDTATIWPRTYSNGLEAGLGAVEFSVIAGEDVISLMKVDNS
ncbi:MAG: hypothetical protein LBS75_06405, partial [Synergistaceae bacterium]|nr:hypothetical protein [Synergistaceae bacterium]